MLLSVVQLNAESQLGLHLSVSDTFQILVTTLRVPEWEREGGWVERVVSDGDCECCVRQYSSVQVVAVGCSIMCRQINLHLASLAHHTDTELGLFSLTSSLPSNGQEMVFQTRASLTLILSFISE